MQTIGVVPHYTMLPRSSREYYRSISTSHAGSEAIPDVLHCGVLETILEVDYGLFKVVLFGAKWYRVISNGRNATIQHDDCGFIRVNTNHTRHSHRIDSDVWIYPSQVDQCFYVPLGPIESDWSVVVPVFPRARRIPQELLDLHEDDPTPDDPS